MNKHKIFLMGLRAGLVLLIMNFIVYAWSPTKRLTWSASSSNFPDIAIGSSNKIHVVWDDGEAISREIYYRSSAGGGVTWSVKKRLTWNTGNSQCPAIAADSANKVHVVWGDTTPGNQEIYYKMSLDGGTTWSSLKRLTWTSFSTRYPDIAVDSGNNIYVVYNDFDNYDDEIYCKKSTNGGSTWQTRRRLTWNSGKSEYAAIATAASGQVHVAWHDDSPGNFEIFYNHSTDGGVNWSSVKRLSWNSGETKYAAIAAASNGHLYIAWQDDSKGNKEIYVKKSTDGGVNWLGAKRMTWDSGWSLYPTITSDSTNAVHIAWADSKDSGYEIYYRKSTDNGASWTVLKRVTWNSSSSFYPTSVCDSNNKFHLAWMDDSPAQYYYEIYYKNN